MLEYIKSIPIPSVYNGIKLGGYRPDPIDSRDLMFKDHVAAVSQPSDGIDLRSRCSAVENQSTSSSCVANSVVGGLELLENLTTGTKFVDLARLFLYYNCRAAVGETSQDSGTFIRLAMQCLSAQGVCSEDAWPFDLTQLSVRPSWKSYREAYTHKIRSFYRIDGTGQDRITLIEAALSTRKPVVFGVSLTKNFIDLTDINAPMPDGSSIGRHAMLIVGYDRKLRVFFVRNSWGTSWGEEGYCTVPYEWLDASSCEDVWCMTGC